MTTQPRREFGQVDRLPSGRYRARFTGPDGRRISAPHTFTTRREATEFLAKTRGELLAGNTAAVIPCTMTLAEYLTQYLHTERERLRPRTLDLYRRTAHHYILNPVDLEGTPITLGTYQLSQLTPHLIRTWHAAVLETARERTMQRRAASLAARQHPARLWAQAAGLAVKSTGRLSPEVLHAWQAAGAPTPAPPLEDPHAGRTVASHAYTLVRAVLNRAFEDGFIPANPARIRGAATAPHHERLPLTPAQVHALANAVPHRYRAAVLLAAWAGLRPGELFALRPQDLNLHEHTVTVTRTLTEISGQPPAFGPPKTQASLRTITLPATVTTALHEHLNTYPTQPHALLFTTPKGTPLTAPIRARILKEPRETIGRPDMTWHHLRHTGATLAAQAGATTAELQHRIGHSTTRAAAIYQHASHNRDQWIAQQLNTLATPPTPEPPRTPGPPEPSAAWRTALDTERRALEDLGLDSQRIRKALARVQVVADSAPTQGPWDLSSEDLARILEAQVQAHEYLSYVQALEVFYRRAVTRGEASSNPAEYLPAAPPWIPAPTHHTAAPRRGHLTLLRRA